MNVADDDVHRRQPGAATQDARRGVVHVALAVGAEFVDAGIGPLRLKEGARQPANGSKITTTIAGLRREFPQLLLGELL